MKRETFKQALKHEGKVHHLSHNDLDGLSPVVLSKAAFENVKYRSVHNNDVDRTALKFLSELDEGDLFIMTDISVSEEVAVEIQKKVEAGAKILLIDHHHSALWLNTYDWAWVEETTDGVRQCATNLYGQLLLEAERLCGVNIDTLRVYLEMVRLWDTWDWSREGKLEPKYLNGVFKLCSIKDFIKVAGRMIQEDKYALPLEYENLVLHEEKQAKRFMKEKEAFAREFDVDGIRVAAVFCEQHHSETGNFIVAARPHCGYVVLINATKGMLSFRSGDNGTDVSVIVKTYGGGGHKNAAGCAMTPESMERYVYPTLLPQMEIKQKQSA